MVRRTPRVVNPKSAPLCWVRQRPGQPVTGERILLRSLVPVIAVACCAGPAALAAQAVVLPGATYVETFDGPAVASAARWRVETVGPTVLSVAFTTPPDDRPAFWTEARQALRTWTATGILPFRFVAAESTRSADVEFRWVERFSTSQAGATHRILDPEGYISRAVVVLARAHADGTPMSPEFRRLVALHEVGHVLGLPHSGSPGDVMHPGNRNLAISSRDLRSVESLYPW